MTTRLPDSGGRSFATAYGDGELEKWPYAEADRGFAPCAAATPWAIRPQFISQEGSTAGTESWLRSTGISGGIGPEAAALSESIPRNGRWRFAHSAEGARLGFKAVLARNFLERLPSIRRMGQTVRETSQPSGKRSLRASPWVTVVIRVSPNGSRNEFATSRVLPWSITPTSGLARCVPYTQGDARRLACRWAGLSQAVGLKNPQLSRSLWRDRRDPGVLHDEFAVLCH